MKPWILLSALAIAGCARGAAADRPYLGQARSLTAEWAMISEQQARGHVTAIYAHTMREQIRTQLDSIPASLSGQNTPYAETVREAAACPEDTPPKRLRALAEMLKQQENALESA